MPCRKGEAGGLMRGGIRNARLKPLRSALRGDFSASGLIRGCVRPEERGLSGSDDVRGGARVVPLKMDLLYMEVDCFKRARAVSAGGKPHFARCMARAAHSNATYAAFCDQAARLSGGRKAEKLLTRIPWHRQLVVTIHRRGGLRNGQPVDQVRGTLNPERLFRQRPDEEDGVLNGENG